MVIEHESVIHSPRAATRNGLRTVHELLTRHHLDLLFLLATAAWFVAALLIYVLESPDNPNIVTIADALWWALVTMTTVGYGDTVPLTLAGRIVAAGLMMSGIAMLGVITANVATLVIKDEVSEDRDLMEGQLLEILQRLEQIEQRLPAKANQPDD